MSFDAGQREMGEYGATKIMCHIQNPYAVNLEPRCKGVQDGAAEAEAET